MTSTPALSCSRTARRTSSGPSASRPIHQPWPPVMQMPLPAARMRGPGDEAGPRRRRGRRARRIPPAEVAHGGDAGLDGRAGAHGHLDRGHPDRLGGRHARGVGLGAEAEVDVAVDQPGQQVRPPRSSGRSPRARTATTAAMRPSSTMTAAGAPARRWCRGGWVAAQDEALGRVCTGMAPAPRAKWRRPYHLAPARRLNPRPRPARRRASPRGAPASWRRARAGSAPRRRASGRSRRRSARRPRPGSRCDSARRDSPALQRAGDDEPRHRDLVGQVQPVLPRDVEARGRGTPDRVEPARDVARSRPAPRAGPPRRARAPRDPTYVAQSLLERVEIRAAGTCRAARHGARASRSSGGQRRTRRRPRPDELRHHVARDAAEDGRFGHAVAAEPVRAVHAARRPRRRRTARRSPCGMRRR